MKSFGTFISEQSVSNFDDATHGQPISIRGFHYGENRLKIDNGRHFHFSDDHSWSAPWVKTNTRHDVNVSFKNPAVFKNSKNGYETDIAPRIPELKAKGHDGIIYTPHNKLDNRQAVHFYPQEGVKVIKKKE